MIGVGALAGPAEAGRFASAGPPVAPDPGRFEVYRRTFDLYMRTYWALQEQFRDVAEMQRG
jgi:hypothetical protein